MEVDRRNAVGIVVIGRNEGERLKRCLASLSNPHRPIVYVDSNSSDGSIEVARAANALIVALDASIPFTAARARNAGFERLLEHAPEIEFAQFIDGDCELDGAWLELAENELSAHRDVAVACGRRRERHPERSVYNRLCDVEWDTPVGDARACGGDSFVRVRAFRSVGGFDASMIAGEEPDLCLRLKRAGFRVSRLDAEMTTHDAAMTRWTQWWQRAARTGHTSAELLAKYGATDEHRRSRRMASALVWSSIVPLAFAMSFAWALIERSWIASIFVLLVGALLYAQLFLRIRRGRRFAGRSKDDASAFAASCILAKWPETWGALVYVARRCVGRKARWIEYKDAPLAGADGTQLR